MRQSLPMLVRVAGLEPARHTATDFKSVVSAIPPYPHEVEGLFPSQPYILIVSQIFEFVNTFLKKIFLIFYNTNLPRRNPLELKMEVRIEPTCQKTVNESRSRNEGQMFFFVGIITPLNEYLGEIEPTELVLHGFSSFPFLLEHPYCITFCEVCQYFFEENFY